MSQEKRILSHLKRGPITPVVALTNYGCYRLAARIYDLKAKGYDIRTRRIDDGDRVYAQYWMKRGK